MWTKDVLSRLSEDKTYSRDELYQAFLSEKPLLTTGSFRWTLYGLLGRKELFRDDFDMYSLVKLDELPSYRPRYSEDAVRLMEKLSSDYPSLNFVVFESILLNEFLNHQIARNTFYIQVQKDLSSYVFETLQETSDCRILLNPTEREFERYWTNGCVVILDLVSQSPVSQAFPHEITAEKMLVDIVADRSIASTFSSSELPDVFENIMREYKTNIRKIFRYAGRRGKAEEIKSFIKAEETYALA